MIKLISANNGHANQILNFYSETCYWKEFVEGNVQGKPYEVFMLEWVVIPRIPFIKVLVDDKDDTKIKGIVVVATIDEFAKMPDYTPYLHPQVMNAFGTWFNFQVANDCVILELYAINKEIRGQGYSKILLDYVDLIQKDNKLNGVSCFVWDCFLESIVVTTKNGFRAKDIIKFKKPINFNLLYMEKRPEFTLTKNYFQSAEYKNISNLLIDNV